MQRRSVCRARGGWDTGTERLEVIGYRLMVGGERKMKSEKLKSIIKEIWAFCSFVFWPRWGSRRAKIRRNGNKNRIPEWMKRL